MPDNEGVAPESTGTAMPPSMEQAFNSALASLEQGTGGEEQAEQVAAPEGEPDGTATQPVVEDPDHIKWVKSIDGDFDKEKGEIVVDRVAKRAYELNKQAQIQAQRINQLDALLQHPVVAQALLQVTGKVPAPAKPAEEPKGEKTDEQILEEWVNERINKAIAPILNENQVLFQKYARDQVESTYEQLKKEFGNDDNGKPLYDSVKEEVGKQLYAASQQVGMPYEQFFQELIKRGVLFPTLSNAAKNLLYPKLKEKVDQVQAKSVQEKKRVQLPSKGTAAQSVQPVAKKVASILDAARQAEEQHPEFKELK